MLDDYEDDFDFEDHYGLDSPKAADQTKKAVPDKKPDIPPVIQSKQSLGRQMSRKSDDNSDLNFDAFAQSKFGESKKASVRASKEVPKDQF